MNAAIEMQQASMGKLIKQILELTKAVAELEVALAKATTIQQKIAQMSAAQKLTVLKKLYAK